MAAEDRAPPCSATEIGARRRAQGRSLRPSSGSPRSRLEDTTRCASARRDRGPPPGAPRSPWRMPFRSALNGASAPSSPSLPGVRAPHRWVSYSPVGNLAGSITGRRRSHHTLVVAGCVDREEIGPAGRDGRWSRPRAPPRPPSRADRATGALGGVPAAARIRATAACVGWKRPGPGRRRSVWSRSGDRSAAPEPESPVGTWSSRCPAIPGEEGSPSSVTTGHGRVASPSRPTLRQGDRPAPSSLSTSSRQSPRQVSSTLIRLAEARFLTFWMPSRATRYASRSPGEGKRPVGWHQSRHRCRFAPGAGPRAPRSCSAGLPPPGSADTARRSAPGGGSRSRGRPFRSRGGGPSTPTPAAAKVGPSSPVRSARCRRPRPERWASRPASAPGGRWRWPGRRCTWGRCRPPW